MTRKPIPADARITYKGVVFTIYQWDQQRFDGTTAVFERSSRPDSVQVIPIKDGKILVAREKQPDSDLFWGLFGGGIEQGEDPLEAAKRELLEETGMVSDRWELLFTMNFTDRLFWNIPYYIAHDCRQIQEHTQEAGEKIDIVPMSFEEFLDVMCEPDFHATPLTLYILKAWKAGKIEEIKRRLLE